MRNLPMRKYILPGNIYEKILRVRGQIEGITSLILSIHLTLEDFFVHCGLRIIYPTHNVTPAYSKACNIDKIVNQLLNHEPCRMLNVQYHAHFCSDR